VKIAQLTREFSVTGGVGTYVTGLVRALAASGQDVCLVHADARAESVLPPATQHYVAGFDAYAADQHETARRVLGVLDRFEPDIVHLQAIENAVLQAQVQRRYPTVKTLHVYDFCPSGAKYHHAGSRVCEHAPGPMCVPRMAYKRCVLTKRPRTIWRMYTRAEAATAVNVQAGGLILASTYVRDQAAASGYPADRLHVIPYFVDLPSGPLTPIPAAPRLLFAGRLEREKGVDRLLLAARRLPGEWTLTVAGGGADLSRLQRLAARLGISDRVSFVGWTTRERLAALYREARVIVVPSLWPEPFGIVGLEAMSHGRPVVAFDGGGIREWLADGRTGFLVRRGDVKGLAERIGDLLRDDKLAEQMGLAGRARVEREFLAPRHVHRLVELYERVAPAAATAAAVP